MDTLSLKKEKKEQKNSKGIPYWAYADNDKKTWFIYPYKADPKGLILLFKLICKKTNEPLYYPDATVPITGTVLTSIDGVKLKVIECEWV